MVESKPSIRVDSKEQDHKLTVENLTDPEICYAQGRAYSSRLLLTIGELPFVAVSYKVNGPLSDRPWGPYKPLKPTEFKPPYGLSWISAEEKRIILEKMGVPIKKAKTAERMDKLFTTHIDARADDYDEVLQRFLEEPELRLSYNEVINSACKRVEESAQRKLSSTGEV